MRGMTDKSVPFIVRRARVLLGMRQREFAMLYGVDEATVAQWEAELRLLDTMPSALRTFFPPRPNPWT